MIGVMSGMNETGLTVTINAAKSAMTPFCRMLKSTATHYYEIAFMKIQNVR